jgi:hypothetical protein
MLEPSSWRELLKQIITAHPAERERLAQSVGVSTASLMRWITGTAMPRPRNLTQLLRAIPPEYQEQFRTLLNEEELALSAPVVEELPTPGIEHDFMMEVLNTRATTPAALHFWSISHLVLQQALRLLDPERFGMAITVVRCMPPGRDGIIRSLRESVGMGTQPWEGDLDQKAMLLGAESLAGHVVSAGHPEAIEDLSAASLLPAYQTEHEVSAMASPILYANHVAGCLLLSSTRKNYFLAPARLSLIADYTRLIALAFNPNEFYPMERIQLRMMPPLEVQRPYLATFRQSVQNLMAQYLAEGQPLNVVDAEQLVWQQIEEELINYLISHPDDLEK